MVGRCNGPKSDWLDDTNSYHYWEKGIFIIAECAAEHQQVIFELLNCCGVAARPDSDTLHQGCGMFCKHCSHKKKIHVFIQPLHMANMLHFWICSSDASKAVIFLSPHTSHVADVTGLKVGIKVGFSKKMHKQKNQTALSHSLPAVLAVKLLTRN